MGTPWWGSKGRSWKYTPQKMSPKKVIIWPSVSEGLAQEAVSCLHSETPGKRARSNEKELQRGNLSLIEERSSRNQRCLNTASELFITAYRGRTVIRLGGDRKVYAVK